jgi:hypothetical protein
VIARATDQDFLFCRDDSVTFYNKKVACRGFKYLTGMSIKNFNSFFIALYNSGAGKNLYKALWHIPKFIFLQIVSLFKAKKANEISVSTQHQIHEEIDTLIK